LLAAYIEVVNCDSYQNFDVAGNGGNADGFAAKMHCGQGIIFTGCRSWENGDDAWDLFETDYSVTISNCWCWKSAMIGGQGNGNGFKMGGNGAGGNSKGVHKAIRCVAFNCKVNNFDQNSHQDGELVQNCLAFTPGNSGYNYFFEGSLNSGATNIFENNAGIPRSGTSGNFSADNNPLELNNSWNLAVTVSAADFGSILETAAKAPRNPDGSLPTGFARLVAGSDLIDKGVDVGLPFNGIAPDLGAFEYSP
jgi:pectate disaccharide-lyase